MFDFILNNFCKLTDTPTSQSPAGVFWQSALGLWSDFWPYVLLIIGVIVLSESLTRHKNPYNSANGFTPAFNRLVGSGSYMLLQIMVYVSIRFIFGDVAYCFPWPYIAHIAVFSLNFTILHGIGFWPEKKHTQGWKRCKNKW